MSNKASIPSDPIRPSDFVRIEARALLELSMRLDGAMLVPFNQAADLLLQSATGQSRIIVTGIGKSGIIARKIAATLRSTGTAAHFLHPAEAVHGDLGMLSRGDTVLALSSSGETEELLRLLPLLKRLADKLITLCGCSTSTLAQASDIVLDTSVSTEACPLNLAPTASTTVMLALGDALALEVSRRRGWKEEDFAELHPGGRLGKRLARVRDLMHSGDALPQVSAITPMPQVIYEMSRKKLGMTTVLSNEDSTQGKLLGMISDGDLRRLLEHDGPHALERTAGDIMNSHPRTINGDAFASSALALMEEKKITSLIVTDEDGLAQGVLHLHDLWTISLL
ncbi:MAG: KpsF/GutQ family protein [Edaphobacter sp.]|nr:KpsF/GutQ family protein [Edaphobacter sp.]